MPDNDLLVERRTAILDGAERCFVSHGFHRATMQDLAKHAGMSVGNLYRYFPSKDAVVLALAERDRAAAVCHLCADDANLWTVLVRLLRHHLVLEPREKAILSVEVWAEASRNPAIAAMIERFDAENQAWISDVLADVGNLPEAEIADLADRIRTEGQGIVVSRALSAGYDPAPAAERLIAAIEERLVKGSGALVLPRAVLEPAQ